MSMDVKDQGEFDFWVGNGFQYYARFNGGSCSGVELGGHFEEESMDGRSPLLWKTCVPSNSSYAYGSLRPFGTCDTVSPRSRRKAIEEGRREMMEMVRNMSESGYELSLKDLVDDQSSKTEQEVVKETSFRSVPEESNKMKKEGLRARSFDKRGQASRSGSMEKEAFLIRMFLPASLITWKMKVPADHNYGSKISRKNADRSCSSRRLLISEKRQQSGRSSSRASSSTRLSKHGDGGFPLGCWPGFWKRKMNKRYTRHG